MRTLCWFVLAFYSTSSFAHVRWFVNSSEYTAVALPMDILTVLTLCAVIGFCLVAHILTRQGYLGALTSTPLFNHSLLFWRIFCASIALFFILNALLGVFIAPNLQLDTGHEILAIGMQITISLFMTISVSISGIAVLILAISTCVLLPFSFVVDYLFELFAIGLALIVIGPYVSLFDQQRFRGISQLFGGRVTAVLILRTLLGLQLVVLGVHNKLMLPGLSQMFLEMYPHYNFFSLIGWSEFTHLHFVWFAGISEVLLGAMLMLGFATRIVMGLLAMIFTITTIVSGAHEVLGHIPIFAMAFVILSESVNQPVTRKENYGPANFLQDDKG